MAENDFMPVAGTRLYFLDYGAAVTLPLPEGNQLAGIQKWGDLPEGEDISEIDTTREDQVDGTGAPDMVTQSEPAYEDPGKFSCTIAGAEQMAAARELRRLKKRFVILYSTGDYAYFDGWVQRTKRVHNERGEVVLDFGVRAKTLLTFVEA